ncbi:MAG: hypothetical protein ACUVQG_15055, partial [Thermogutta sp.]
LRSAAEEHLLRHTPGLIRTIGQFNTLTTPTLRSQVTNVKTFAPKLRNRYLLHAMVFLRCECRINARSPPA